MDDLLNEIADFNEDTQKGKYLTFPIEKGLYAIEIKFVTEIIGIQSITQMPELPSFVKGIINLRGKIIPVIDVRLRFNKEPMEYNDRTCIIVIDFKDTYLGLIVDNVSEVLEISEENIIIPPNINSTAENKYIKEIGKTEKEVCMILSCEKLVCNSDYKKLNQIA